MRIRVEGPSNDNLGLVDVVCPVATTQSCECLHGPTGLVGWGILVFGSDSHGPLRNIEERYDFVGDGLGFDFTAAVVVVEVALVVGFGFGGLGAARSAWSGRIELGRRSDDGMQGKQGRVMGTFFFFVGGRDGESSSTS